jgi:hypothetical protein
MNIIATAQIKNLYSQDTGEFMKVIGSEPDGPKDAPYLFDVVLELSFGPNDTRIATVKKDRTNTLPPTFEFNYQELVKHFGIKDLERAPVKLRAEAVLNQVANRNVKIKVGGRDLLSAGVTGETLTKLMKSTASMSEVALKDKLNEDYSVQSLLDLREDEAQMLLTDLTKTEVNV